MSVKKEVVLEETIEDQYVPNKLPDNIDLLNDIL